MQLCNLYDILKGMMKAAATSNLLLVPNVGLGFRLQSPALVLLVTLDLVI